MHAPSGIQPLPRSRSGLDIVVPTARATGDASDETLATEDIEAKTATSGRAAPARWSAGAIGKDLVETLVDDRCFGMSGDPGCRSAHGRDRILPGERVRPL